jgi:hypothetical protein
MFGLFKSDPTKKMRKQHASLQEKAMHAQRNGDMRLFAELTSQAEDLWKEIEKAEKSQ